MSRTDSDLRQIANELSDLSSGKKAAFFAALSERFLIVYKEFVCRTGWGNWQRLRDIQDDCWAAIIAESQPIATHDEIMQHAPPGDEINAPASTYAQDVVILLDAARSAAAGESINLQWIEFGIEPVLVSLCLEQTGFCSLESVEQEKWEDRASGHISVQTELEIMKSILQYLQGASAVDRRVIEDIKSAVNMNPPILNW